jgi:UDP-N-acetylglucosamine--N-acetylmuramyl-(pentapeptide) pyrophosphoryl-undecaprenol N-acetylglucosamine transferase
VAYNGLEQWFPKEKIHFTGNPLRGNINGDCDRNEAAAYFKVNPEKPVVLLVGGSQGALGINKGITAQLDKFKGSDMQLIWQTGKFYQEEALRQVHEMQLEAQVKPVVFIDRMDLAYSVADVVISRAGAMSISELALVRKPVIFVPLPTAAEDHQTKNAMQLVEANAAMMVRNDETEQKLIPTLQQLLDDKAKQETMKNNITQFARPNAADDIVNIILQEIKK